MRLLFFAGFLFQLLGAAGQQFVVSGTVKSSDGDLLTEAFISLGNEKAVTDRKGYFSISVDSGTYPFSISHVGYNPLDTVLEVTSKMDLEFTLSPSTTVLDEVEVGDRQILDDTRSINVTKLDAKSIREIPSAFGDFSRVLVTLPGVSSNNELSSGYSVRGGNFDENLVYVNDIPVYRPFLSNAGQQEGLSFVNPDLVADVSFYAGGWDARYGDKLSSSLNIEYKEPSKREGSVSIGLLGGSAHFGNSSQNENLKYVVGVRHRDSRYLLGRLEVDGQYFPTYTDAQALVTVDLSGKKSLFRNKTVLNVLGAYSRNRYLTLPESQLTEFGSVTQNLRIQTGFQGREQLNYDTYQVGFRLQHRFDSNLRTYVTGSYVDTRETENYEVEGIYRLCDVDNNPGSATFDECVSIRGLGSQYDYGRNSLDARLISMENGYEWFPNENNVLKTGVGVQYQQIEDDLNEYSFNDSADFSQLTYSAFNALSVENIKPYHYFIWEHFSEDSVHVLNAGLRTFYWNQNKEWYLSPRMQYQFRPDWKRPVRFNLSAGIYQQPPFYREFRDRQGQINRNVDPQKAIHLIGGFDRFLVLWGRPFVFSTQAYYKKLTDVIPYEIDNVRLRYFARNVADGATTGFDARINGEFIRGTQSWFSLGYLKSVENIQGDGRGDIRRPLDQRINLGVYFEDHMPTDSTLKVYVNLVFGSGYPVGPPGDPGLRNIFSGDEYYRADIGLSKEFYVPKLKNIEIFAIRLEVLNAFAADNTLSYTWIQDVNGTSFAIPNSLTARFFNVKLITRFN